MAGDAYGTVLASVEEPWTLTSAPKPYGRLWPSLVAREIFTQIRDTNSPARDSPLC